MYVTTYEDPPSHTVEHLDDTALIARARDGDEDAYACFYLRHVDLLRAYAARRAPDPGQAEDLAAECFARTLAALRKGKGPREYPKAYLFTVLHNLLRDGHAQDLPLVFDSGISAAVVPVNVWGEEQSRVEDVLIARETLNRLPEHVQQILALTVMHDLPASQVAPMLGLTPNATSVAAHRAREALSHAYLTAVMTYSTCGEDEVRLAAYTRGSLGRREARKVADHIATCKKCAAAQGEMTHVNRQLTSLQPVVLLDGVSWPAVFDDVLGYRDLTPAARPAPAAARRPGKGFLSRIRSWKVRPR